MMHVEVRPELLRWARDRGGFELGDLARRIPHLPAWEQEDARPTLKQIERFARVTYTPVGFLFLQEPPIEPIPNPDAHPWPDDRIRLDMKHGNTYNTVTS